VLGASSAYQSWKTELKSLNRSYTGKKIPDEAAGDDRAVGDGKSLRKNKKVETRQRQGLTFLRTVNWQAGDTPGRNLSMGHQQRLQLTTIAALVRSEYIDRPGAVEAFLHRRKSPAWTTRPVTAVELAPESNHKGGYEYRTLLEQDYREMVSTARGIRANTKYIIGD
jgi:hypothetical protein